MFQEENVVLVKSDGTRHNISALAQSERFFVRDDKIPIEEGETFERTLPNKILEEYLVLESNYYSRGRYRYQIKVRKKSSLLGQKPTSPITITQTGDNAKVNIDSEDNSININNIDLSRFEDIKRILTTEISDEAEQKNCLNSLNELQESVGKQSYIEKYKQFIATVANHMAIIYPFIPYLTTFITKVHS
jgi:hypothetical protein